jgi:hypothetical protein
VDERGKLEVFAREIEAWNSGDLELLMAELTEDHEWDLTRSSIPAEKEVHCGHAAYLAFARRWRDALGATQLKIVEAKELPDGRLFTRLLHTGTGARSGASVDRATSRSSASRTARWPAPWCTATSTRAARRAASRA